MKKNCILKYNCLRGSSKMILVPVIDYVSAAHTHHPQNLDE